MIIKKVFVFFISLVLMVSLTPIKSSSLSNDNCNIILQYKVGSKQYYVGDVPKLMDSEPEIKDSRMFLVIRFVTQHIPGTTLDWDGTERKVTIKTPGGKMIRLWIGNPKAEVNGKMVLIDPENPDKIVPYIKDGRTKLPMRFVGEQLNAKIDWIASSSTVVLTVQDIINCSCSWLEGCIVQWSEAPSNQYQLSFVLNCDKKSTLERYLVEKDLKSTTDGADLTEYLQKYPKPPYPTTKICLNQVRKILKWDPVATPGGNPPPPDPPNPPPPPDPPKNCCDYELFQVSQAIAKLKPGESSFYVFMVRSNCPNDTNNISFQFAPLSNVTSIAPSQLVLPPKQELMFKVFFTMPQNSLDGSSVTFSFKIGTDCSEKVEHSFMIQCDSPTVPPEPPLKSFCGCFSQFNAESADITKIWFNEACNEPEGKWKVYIIPNSLKDVNLGLLISEYMVKYPLKKYKFLCLEIYVDEKGVVKKWRATPEKYPDCCKPPTNKGPGRVIASLGSQCVGVITSFASLSDPGAQIVRIEANIKGNSDSGCVLIFGDTYRVSPHSDGFKFTPEFIDIKITESCPDGIIRVSFDAAEIPPSCCKWQFRLIPETQSENWTLAPGETKVIEAYEVINTCSLNANKLQFTIDWPNDGKIVSITPKTFTLKPSEHQVLKITIIMPEDSVPDENVSFPYTIAPDGCEKKEIQLTVRGKRFLCKGTSVKVKVTEINWREGWVWGFKLVEKLDGIQGNFAVPVQIFFETKSDYWKKLVVYDCFEICYDERNDSSGKLIKWGLDYRKIECY